MNENKRVWGLTEKDLLGGLHYLSSQEKKTVATFLVYLGEVDRRRLYAKWGYSSLFRFVTEELGYSEDAAYKRIQGARAAKKHEEIYDLISQGKLTLSALSRLAPYLGKPKGEELLRASLNQRVRQVEELIVSFFPKAEKKDRVKESASPLSVDRVQVSFSASRAFAKDLERAKALLRHKYPEGRLGDILHEALRLLLQEKTPQPPKRKSSPPLAARQVPTRHIPQGVQYEVWRRDGGSCTFEANGKRCAETAFIEWDHRVPFSMGGSSNPENLRLLCRTHNRWLADQYFGKTFMEMKIQKKQEAKGQGTAEGSA